MSEKRKATIDNVRAVVEKIARDRNCSIQEVTESETREFLGNGSSSYAGAHLQTVKIEDARAKLLVEKQISTQTMAAIYDEIKRFSDNSREVALSEAEVTQQMFGEACELNEELEQELLAKGQQLTEQQHNHTEKVHQIELALQTAQMEKNTLEIRYNDTLQSRDKAEQMLGDAQVELGALTSQLSQLETKRAEQDTATTELREKLEQIGRKYDTARKSNQKAEQRAELLTWKNEQVINENTEIKKKLELAIERAANAEAHLKVLNETQQESPGQTGKTRVSKTSKAKKPEK